MKRFRKISRLHIASKSDKKEQKAFYNMLLKFEKRHPEFSAFNVFLKLYPDADLDSVINN